MTPAERLCRHDRNLRDVPLDVHRNLFNADVNAFFYSEIVERFPPAGDRYTPKTIHRYVRMLADAGVDTLLVNPNTQVAWYPSESVPTVLDDYTRGDTGFFDAARALPDPDRDGAAHPNYQSSFDVERWTRLFDPVRRPSRGQRRLACRGGTRLSP